MPPLPEKVASLRIERKEIAALRAAPDPTIPAAPPLHLTPEPSPSSGDGEITREQLDRWHKMYGPAHRQLRRWIERGKARGDPCPLDDPLAMPAWVDKNIDKVRRDMRDLVQAAADTARAALPPPPESTVAGPPLPGASAQAATPGGAKPLDLASVGGVEGEAVELFRRLFAAAKLQLEEAYQGANEERIAKLHTRLERVGESLRKHEAAAEAKAKRRGELLEKAEVINEVAQALATLKLMHEQMAKFILAEMPELDPPTAEKLRSKIELVRDRELSRLRNLSAYRPDVLALAA